VTGPLADLLRRARQRVIGNLVLEQASFGLMLALACGVLLLLLGTQILDWYWPVVLFAAGFAWGVARFWKQLPGDYRIAQVLDQKLALPDTLSTAFHFAQPGVTAPSSELRDVQHAQAQEAARLADVTGALPYTVRRHALVTAGLAVVFLGLMLVRYGRQNGLDLSQPLVPGVADLFGTATGTGSPLAQLPKNQQQTKPPEPFEGTAQSEDDRKLDEAQSLNEAPEDVLKTIGVPEVDNSSAEQNKKGDLGKEGGDEGKETDNAEGEQGDSPGGQDAGNKSNADAKNAQQDPNAKGEQKGGSENNSLLDKFRDAMANLMNKVKQPGTKGNDQMAKNQSGPKDGSAQGKGERQQAGEKGQQGEGKPNAEGGEGEQKGDSQAGDQDQSAQGKGASESSQQKAGEDPKSGMGKQDGSKDVKLTQHNTEALGKLSEIIGKRSEKQTGELMVEVSSGKNQSLRTAYSTKGGAHADSGGEIHRDEVPLMYQQYVQTYFEQLRRTTPAAPTPAAPTPAKK